MKGVKRRSILFYVFSFALITMLIYLLVPLVFAVQKSAPAGSVEVVGNYNANTNEVASVEWQLRSVTRSLFYSKYEHNKISAGSVLPSPGSQTAEPQYRMNCYGYAF